jgi:putative phosphoribosyl transferase
MRAAKLLIPPFGQECTIDIPPACRGIVIFAHGSGSSRFSPRNRAVARGLHDFGFATLLFDLLSEEEAVDRGNVFDIGLLSRRLLLATNAVRECPDLAGLPIGYFGASTGAAAALTAAGAAGSDIAAVVSRGGRPDLAAASLPRVAAPTLLIVGGEDLDVLALNRQALARLRCEKELAIVPGATHLFEEPGALEQVTSLAGEWFRIHFGAAAG